MNVYAISRHRNALRALNDTALLERADDFTRQLDNAFADDWEDLPRIRRELNEIDGIILERAVQARRLPELRQLEDVLDCDTFTAYRALLTT